MSFFETENYKDMKHQKLVSVRSLN